jgi:hypothetical protein
MGLGSELNKPILANKFRWFFDPERKLNDF